MPAEPKWLRAALQGAGVGAEVDRAARVIRGAILAAEGPFREPDPRGEFDAKGLKMIVEQVNARKGGLKTRFGHPSASGDSLGKYMGRARNARLGTVTVEHDGQKKKLKCCRGDVHLSDTAFNGNPNGDLGNYVMNLAEEDPTALAMSLVIEPNEEVRLEKDGSRKKDEKGNPLPPLWYPKKLHACDFVDEGAATDGLLSPEQWAAALSVGMTPDLAKALNFDNAVRLGSQMLDSVFSGQPRDVVQARLTGFLNRYLDRRYGVSTADPGDEDDEEEDDDEVDALTPDTVLVTTEAVRKAKLAKLQDNGYQQDGNQTGDNELDVGDHVKIVTPHDPSHKSGIVRQVIDDQCALGVEIDGSGEIHHWYLESEVMLDQEEQPADTPAGMSANDPESVRKAQMDRHAKLVNLDKNNRPVPPVDKDRLPVHRPVLRLKDK